MEIQYYFVMEINKKTTIIKKVKHDKSTAIVIESDKKTYFTPDESIKTRKMTISEQNAITKDIDKLSKNDHMMIYLMIRENQSKVLHEGKVETVFNLKELDNELRWKLRSLVNMSLENKARDEMKKSALVEHQEHIDSLNSRIDVNKDKDRDKIVSERGPTEREKYATMLAMNDS